MAKRGRPAGSRNRSRITPRIVAEQMEAELVEQTDMASIAPQVEEKFNNFPPARDSEQEKKILAAMENLDEDDDLDEPVEELPFYLRNLPEGSDRRKHIVAAAQAAIILGTAPAQVAEQFGISHARINQWKNTLITTGAIGRRDRISDMLMAYIEQEMKSLLAISLITSNEEWVVRQDADKLAHYIAVKSDRLLMLLQAFTRTTVSQREYEQQLKVLTNNA